MSLTISILLKATLVAVFALVGVKLSRPSRGGGAAFVVGSGLRDSAVPARGLFHCAVHSDSGRGLDADATHSSALSNDRKHAVRRWNGRSKHSIRGDAGDRRFCLRWKRRCWSRG
jgi:hypothetical protein